MINLFLTFDWRQIYRFSIFPLSCFEYTEKNYNKYFRNYSQLELFVVEEIVGGMNHGNRQEKAEEVKNSFIASLCASKLQSYSLLLKTNDDSNDDYHHNHFLRLFFVCLLYISLFQSRKFLARAIFLFTSFFIPNSKPTIFLFYCL